MSATTFGGMLRQLREQRGLSLRALANRIHYSHAYVWDIETGRKAPTPDLARRLDDALDTDGALTQLLPTPTDHGVDVDRLAYIAKSPRSVDQPTIDALNTVLAGQRRLEDVAGATMVRDTVMTQLLTIEQLVVDARESLRHPVITLASQWAQFAGWLSATTGHHQQGRSWYLRAMEWATEIGDADMIATALSMRGHLAWTLGEIKPMLALSRSAQWPPAKRAVTANAVQQEARAYAILGDATACDDALDRAEDLATAAVDDPSQIPPWMYFYDPTLFVLQRGLAYLCLGRHDQAAQLLNRGLAKLPPETRYSDWIGWYVTRLARAYLVVAPDLAVSTIDEARRIAESNGSVTLTTEVCRIARELEA
ncbi:MAG: helix-turn-helix domain-containing protein [Micromonosporaceae bacterium]|nr:helix-turn-helix domain-containing protein [Micromonosporaceae bacterium]